jgi:hypothetical protein
MMPYAELRHVSEKGLVSLLPGCDARPSPPPRLIVCVVARALTLRAKAKGLEAVRAFGSLGCDMPAFMKVSVCTSQAVAIMPGSGSRTLAPMTLALCITHRTTSATHLAGARRVSPSSTAPRSQWR